MIPDSRGNRIVTRGFIGMVSAMPLISITLTIFAILLPFTGPLSLPKCTIFAWCLCESSLWVWLRVQTLQRQESWTRVIPSGEERKKLKEDWVHIIHSQDEEGAIEFVEGWFKTGNRRTQLREIHLENVKDWYAWFCNHAYRMSRLCSAFFAGTREQIGADSALLAEMQEALTDLCNALQQRLPEWKIPEGRNPNVDSVRLTLDPIKCEHRPLIFYFVITPLAVMETYWTGGLFASKFCVDPFSSSRLLLSQVVASLRTGLGLLVQAPHRSRFRTSTYCRHPWCWFNFTSFSISYAPP